MSTTADRARERRRRPQQAGHALSGHSNEPPSRQCPEIDRPPRPGRYRGRCRADQAPALTANRPPSPGTPVNDAATPPATQTTRSGSARMARPASGVVDRKMRFLSCSAVERPREAPGDLRVELGLAAL
jgi:hypothetical protein